MLLVNNLFSLLHLNHFCSYVDVSSEVPRVQRCSSSAPTTPKVDLRDEAAEMKQKSGLRVVYWSLVWMPQIPKHAKA